MKAANGGLNIMHWNFGLSNVILLHLSFKRKTTIYIPLISMYVYTVCIYMKYLSLGCFPHLDNTTFGISPVEVVSLSLCMFVPHVQSEPGQADGERQHGAALLLPDWQQRVSETAAAGEGLHRHRLVRGNRGPSVTCTHLQFLIPKPVRHRQNQRRQRLV